MTAPIVGATQLAHVDEAVAAVDVALSDDEVAGPQQPCGPHPVLGHS